ncbi:cation:dicarboxylate symporter family transporter [Novispirillum itersonii]|nr:cation:dicarboxylase symporter family transporter [Novispirillum itersonii]
MEAIGYIIAVDRVVDMMRTATNVTGQALVAVLVARTEGLLNKDVFNGAYLADDDTPVAAAAKA